MKKRILALIIASVMVISITACGNSKTSDESGKESKDSSNSSTSLKTSGESADSSIFSTSEEQADAWTTFEAGLKNKYKGKSLNIISVSDPWAEPMMKLTSVFEDLTGATVKFTTLGYDACYSKETLIASQSSGEADLFVYDIPWLGAMADHMVPLNDFLTKNSSLVNYDDFFKVVQEASTWKKNVIGLPFAPYFTMLTYNTKIFQEAGLETPKNFTDLEKTAAALKTDTVAGIALNNQSGTCVGQAYFEYIYNMGGKPFQSVYPGSPDYYADMTPLLNSKESLAVVKMFKDMIKNEGTGAINMAWNERFSTFASGKAAMMSPWITDIMPLDDPSQSLVVGSYATAPAVCADGVKQHTPVGGYSMGVSKYSENQDLAMDYLAWFTAPETAYEFATTGGLPARYSIVNNKELASKYVYYNTLKDIVDTAFPAFRPQIPEAFKIMDTVGTYIGKYLDGSMNLEDAMNKANSEVATLLKSAGYTVKD